MATPTAGRRPEVLEPSAAASRVMGLVGGLVVAAAFTAWEWSLVRWMGLQVPIGDDRERLLLLHGLLGGGLGALLGALRLRSGSWALAMATTLGGWLLCGKL